MELATFHVPGKLVSVEGEEEFEAVLEEDLDSQIQQGHCHESLVGTRLDRQDRGGQLQCFNVLQFDPLVSRVTLVLSELDRLVSRAGDESALVQPTEQ